MPSPSHLGVGFGHEFLTAVTVTNMRPLIFSARLLFVIALLLNFVGCESINRASKPKAAATSVFLPHAAVLKPEPGRSPFLLNWTNPSAKVQTAAKTKTEIYIAPVSLAYLRPISKSVSRIESNDLSQKAAAAKLGETLRREFTLAFQKSPKSRYRVVLQPTRNAVTLELSLIELNPNSISAGTLRTAVNIVAVPGIDSLIGRPLKSSIAIEGRLTDPSTRQSLFEFADNEESKSAFLVSFRDFTTYGQARQAIREWAAQFEELTRTPANHNVKDSSSFMFLPW